MSLVRGIQSAVFYYLSCGPWHGYSYSRKRRKEASRDKREKEALAVLQPDLYINPAPFEMNPGWAEEVRAGPGPPPRKARKKHKMEARNTRDLTSAGTQSSTHSGKSKIDLASTETSPKVNSWNAKRFQRADEEPWASTSTIAVPPPALPMRRGSSIGLAGWSTPETHDIKYTTSPKCVAVSTIDSLPPFMSTLPTDISWMKEPPPSATFMSGKDARPCRSRSDSHTSIKRDGDFRHYSPIRESPSQEYLRERRTTRVDSSHDSDGQHHDRNRSPRARPKQSPASTATTMLSESSTSVALPPLELLKSPKPTYDSSSGITSGRVRRTPSTPLRERSQNIEARGSLNKGDHPPVVVRDSSLNTLQELVSPSTLMQSRFIRSPAPEARVSLPTSESAENLQLRMPTIVDGWFAREELELDLPVPRDRSMRWSLDI